MWRPCSLSVLYWDSHGEFTLPASCQLHASFMIGVDRSPLHVAGATSTPTIAVWTHPHPAQFFDLAEHILHPVPEGHKTLAMGPKTLAHFHKNCRHHVYMKGRAGAARRAAQRSVNIAPHTRPRNQRGPNAIRFRSAVRLVQEFVQGNQM